MVKNQQGGNKSKKMGRKFTSAPIDRKLRLLEDEDERYAVVTKLLGNGMCNVDTAKESSELLCVIRKKFKGRGKRDNSVKIGSVILIGLRSFETVKDNSKQKCDLLEVYSEFEINKLKKDGHISHLTSKINTQKDDDDIIFEDEQTTSYRNMIQNNLQNEEIVDCIVEDDDEIDIDDI
tara:strand:- start:588 stop:1121 length:534 start_codon:yes stop_codon:yes gene_type:complete